MKDTADFYASAQFCAQLDDYAERTAATLPPLTPAQTTVLRGLFNPADLTDRLAALADDPGYQAGQSERVRLRAMPEYAAERDRLRDHEARDGPP